jgi:uncharacterized protein (DUF1499 family)
VAVARLIAMGLAALLLIVAVSIVILRIYFGRASESELRPGEDVAITAFSGPLAENAFLACPPGSCAVKDVAPSPVFKIPADRLAQYWSEIIDAEPRMTPVETEPRHHGSVYIQRSALFRFPDLITVELIALAPDRSGLAIYSRARYGRSDFGVNRRRVLRWLSRLQRMVGPENQ